MNNLIQENIYNLTSLWKQASTTFDAYFEEPEFEFCVVKNSNWPNRLWFKNNVDEKNLVLAKDRLLKTSEKMIIPYWSIYDTDTSNILEKVGFKKVFEQVGMSIPLSTHYAGNSDLEIKYVNNNNDTLLWTQIFFKAFGYHINPDLLLPVPSNTKILLAYYNSEPVGTGIFHKTGEISGIHSIGIIPEKRKMGLAERLMKIILNLSINEGSTYATLQASEMGKGLYLKLGFDEQFKIKNYVLEG